MSLKYINGRCTTVFPKGNSSVVYINGRSDAVKPRLSSAVTQSATRVRLTFNEPMSATGIDDTSHYSFSGAGQGTGPAVIDHIHINSTTEIDLDLTGEMTTGTANYSVAVIHVTDTVGNVIDPSYDDATFNGIGVAPQVVSATVIDSTHIDVLFNEAMEQTTMDTAGHYTITGDATPAVSAAAHSSTTVVRLTTAAMADGNYSVGVIHCTDLVGNVIDSAHDDAAFTVHTYAWYAQTLAGVTTGTFVRVGIDSDGSHLIAALSGTHIYTSTDSGANWTERDPASSHQVWNGAASDADGSNLIVAAQNTHPYTSVDGGGIWTERNPNTTGHQSWYYTASDSDGSVLVAVVSGTHVHVSQDSGDNWDERSPAGAGHATFASCASDADGTNLIVGGAGDPGGHVWLSSDSGATWAEKDPGTDGHVGWYAVGTSSDGSKLIACWNDFSANGRVYLSTDSGANWTVKTIDSITGGNWYAADMSDDGTVIAVAEYGAHLYVSRDSGATWVAQTGVGDGSGHADWRNIKISGDGKCIIACSTTAGAGRVYVYK